MGRGKVSLTLIENEAIRRASLKRRRQVLLKKVSELTTLCGLPGACMVYHPEDPEPVIWPTHDGLRQQLNEYFSIPEVERSKKTTTQESFLKDRITRERVNYAKLTKKVDELKEAVLLDEVYNGRGINGLESDELDKLASLLKEKVEEIKKRKEFYEGLPHEPQPPQPVNLEADGGVGEEGPNQDGAVAVQQQTQGGGAEIGLDQQQQTLNIHGGSSHACYNNIPAQFGVQTLDAYPTGSAYGQQLQLAFGNTFPGSSYETGQGSVNDPNMQTVFPEGSSFNLPPPPDHALFSGGSNFHLPPLSPSTVVHYHQQGGGLDLDEPVVVVGGGMDNDDQLGYYGDQFTRSFFEQGISSSLNPEPMAQGQLPQEGGEEEEGEIEAYDNSGNRVWPPEARDLPPME